MKKLFLKNVLLWVLLCSWLGQAQGQTNEALSLTQQVYNLNNAFNYVESQALIHAFIDKPEQTAENRYYAYLCLSYTYKRQFDYASTLKCLEQALAEGLKTENPNYYLHNIQAQQAMALFDINQYKKSDSLMKQLSKANYQDIDEENRSKIFMQEAYLHYLDGKYAQAEQKYLAALEVMKRSSPCDLPMIYGKMLLLYGKMGDFTKIEDTYQRSLASSDSCDILKYAVYTHRGAAHAFCFAGDFEKAYSFFSLYDTFNTVYEKKVQLAQMYDLEQKYQVEGVRRELLIAEQAIETKNAYVIITIAIAVIVLLGGLVYLLWHRQQVLAKEEATKLQFTKQLLLGVEEERKRIASDLHDGVGHELLVLKQIAGSEPMQQGIATAIASLREISRNLHPAMFETIGLQASVEQLAERMGESQGLLVVTEISYEQKRPLAVELQIYRMIQEALANAMKYAQAVAAKVSIISTDSHIAVTIQDNGKGFDVANALQSGKSFGLQSILQRSIAVGGKASISSNTQGTIIHIKVP